MMKLMLVTTMKEKKTPNTMYRYNFKIRGLLWEKRRLLVLPRAKAEEFLEEADEKEEKLCEKIPYSFIFVDKFVVVRSWTTISFEANYPASPLYTKFGLLIFSLLLNSSITGTFLIGININTLSSTCSGSPARYLF